MKIVSLSACLLFVMFFSAAIMSAEQKNDEKQLSTAEAQARVAKNVGNDKDKKQIAEEIIIKKVSAPPEIKGLKN